MTLTNSTNPTITRRVERKRKERKLAATPIQSNERALSSRATAAQLARLRAAATVAAGLVLCGLAALVLMIAWPSSRWTAGISDLAFPHRLAIMVLANCVVLVAAYLAAATLVWTIADATMAQPRDLDEFDVRPGGGWTWRIAHLSDIHV
jgi:uncharacterized membrane protein YqjE